MCIWKFQGSILLVDSVKLHILQTLTDHYRKIVLPDSKTRQYISTVAHHASLFRRGTSTERSENATSHITTPTRSILNAHNEYPRILHTHTHAAVVLSTVLTVSIECLLYKQVIIASLGIFYATSTAVAILQLKKISKWKYMHRMYVIIHLKAFKCYFLVFNDFPIDLKENLREEDNLSTRDKCPVPNVSFVRRFYWLYITFKYLVEGKAWKFFPMTLY